MRRYPQTLGVPLGPPAPEDGRWKALIRRGDLRPPPPRDPWERKRAAKPHPILDRLQDRQGPAL